MYGTSDTFGVMVQSVYCTIFVRGVEDAAPYEVLSADSCRGRRRGVKKTCLWHVFSPDLGGYAAVASILVSTALTGHGLPRQSADWLAMTGQETNASQSSRPQTRIIQIIFPASAR